MIFITNNLSRFGQREFEIELNLQEFAQADFDFLSAALKGMVEQGARFQEDDLVQIGSVLCRIRATPDRLCLEEPDFQSFPINWVPGCSETMIRLRIQNYVADSVGLRDSLDHPSIRQSALTCDRLSATSGFHMERLAPNEPSDSGWAICCANPQHAHIDSETLATDSLYSISLISPESFQFLALPPGSAVTMNAGSFPRLILNGNLLQVVQGSYLRKKYLRIRPGYGA